MQVMYKQGQQAGGARWIGNRACAGGLSVGGDSPENDRTSGSAMSWWARLRSWLTSAIESPGKLTLRIDDPPGWSPDGSPDGRSDRDWESTRGS
ncbi:MAG TPA: hypothetical protein VM470_06025 [Acidimicrobiia bacterium]|nr:hypothetical protein [Acidimicrobiia bacterium]